MYKYILFIIAVSYSCKIKQNDESCITAFSRPEVQIDQNLSAIGGFLFFKFDKTKVNTAYNVLKQKNKVNKHLSKEAQEQFKLLIDNNYSSKCTIQVLPLNNSSGLKISLYTAQHCMQHIYFATEVYTMISVITKSGDSKYIKVPIKLNLMSIRDNNMLQISEILQKNQISDKAKYDISYIDNKNIFGYFNTSTRVNSTEELLSKEHDSYFKTTFDKKNKASYSDIAKMVYSELNIKKTPLANNEITKELTEVNLCSFKNTNEFDFDSDNESLNCFIVNDMIVLRGNLLPESTIVDKYLSKKLDYLREVKKKFAKAINSDIFTKWEDYSIKLEEFTYTLSIKNSLTAQLENCNYGTNNICPNPTGDHHTFIGNINNQIRFLNTTPEYNKLYNSLLNSEYEYNTHKENVGKFIFYKNFTKAVMYQELLKVSKENDLIKSAAVGTNNLIKTKENTVAVTGFQVFDTKSIARLNYSPFYLRPYGTIYFEKEGKLRFDKTDSGSTFIIGGLYPISVLSSYNNVPTSGGFTQVQLPVYDEKVNAIDEDLNFDNNTTVDSTQDNNLNGGCNKPS